MRFAYIHLAGTDAHDTTQTGCAEFQTTTEARLKLFRVVTFDKSRKLALGGRIGILFEPGLSLSEEIGRHDGCLRAIEPCVVGCGKD